MGMKGKQSFLASFFSLGVGSVIYLIIGLIGTPIITRLVDPVDYGNMSMLSVYSNIGLMVFGLGLDQALLRYYYQDETLDYRKRLLYECFSLPMILAIVVGVVGLVEAIIGIQAGLVPWSIKELCLLELNILVLIIHRYSILIVRLRNHTNLYSIINIVQKSLYVILTVVFVVFIKGYYYEILAISTILSTLIASLLGVLKEKDIWTITKPKINLSFTRIELLKYSIPIMFSSGITIVFNALDKLALDAFCSRSDVGVYSSAMNLMAVFTVVRSSFNALWMPAAVEHYEKYPEDKSFFQKGNSFITLLMFTIGAGLILCKDLFVLLLGKKYQDASMIIPFLMFEPIMYTISETTATGIVVQKRSSYQVIVAAVACAVNFVGNWILTPRLGPRGAAISTGIAYIVFFGVRTALSNKVFYVDYKLCKFSIITCLLLGYAYYGSLSSFSMLQLIMFAGLMFIIGVLYREELGSAVQYGKSIAKKVMHKQ